MPKASAASLFLRGATCLAMLPHLAPPAAAQAADRWTADEARAILPQPRENVVARGGFLSCAAQRWTLRLDAAEGVELAGGDAELRVDGSVFATRSTADKSALNAAVPRDALESLKSGLRLDIVLHGSQTDTAQEVSFSLRGSRLAINAAEERCTLRDMSAYQAVSLTPSSFYIDLAQELRGADIETFAAATASRPVLDATMAEFGDGRRVLFARLCGSSWYYGASGCNITGFVHDEKGAATGWRVVYDSENVLLHTDPANAQGGWRDIVTLPARGPGPGRVWRWNGSAYALHGDLPEDADDAPPAPRADRN